MIVIITAVVAVTAIGLVLLVVLSACTVSGNISEMERRQEACLGFARGGETGQNEPENGSPIDNKQLSLGQTGIEDDNAD